MVNKTTLLTLRDSLVDYTCSLCANFAWKREVIYRPTRRGNEIKNNIWKPVLSSANEICSQCLCILRSIEKVIYRWVVEIVTSSWRIPSSSCSQLVRISKFPSFLDTSLFLPYQRFPVSVAHLSFHCLYLVSPTVQCPALPLGIASRRILWFPPPGIPSILFYPLVLASHFFLHTFCPTFVSHFCLLLSFSHSHLSLSLPTLPLYLAFYVCLHLLPPTLEFSFLHRRWPFIFAFISWFFFSRSTLASNSLLLIFSFTLVTNSRF